MLCPLRGAALLARRGVTCRHLIGTTQLEAALEPRHREANDMRDVLGGHASRRSPFRGELRASLNLAGIRGASMERLWSIAAASAGKSSTSETSLKRQIVATSCDWLPSGAHGKEGVVTGGGVLPDHRSLI